MFIAKLCLGNVAPRSPERFFAELGRTSVVMLMWQIWHKRVLLRTAVHSSRCDLCVIATLISGAPSNSSKHTDCTEGDSFALFYWAGSNFSLLSWYLVWPSCGQSSTFFHCSATNISYFHVMCCLRKRIHWLYILNIYSSIHSRTTVILHSRIYSKRGLYIVNARRTWSSASSITECVVCCIVPYHCVEQREWFSSLLSSWISYSAAIWSLPVLLQCIKPYCGFLEISRDGEREGERRRKRERGWKTPLEAPNLSPLSPPGNMPAFPKTLVLRASSPCCPSPGEGDGEI